MLREILVYPKRKAPPESLRQVTVRPGKGLDGDHLRSPWRQVTLLSTELWERACHELGVQLPPSSRRANLVLSGTPLQLGSTLQIGELLLRVTGETKPCKRMDAVYPGLRQALVPEMRGGVYCVVLHPGVVRVGDTVRILAVAS